MNGFDFKFLKPRHGKIKWVHGLKVREKEIKIKIVRKSLISKKPVLDNMFFVLGITASDHTLTLWWQCTLIHLVYFQSILFSNNIVPKPCQKKSCQAKRKNVIRLVTDQMFGSAKLFGQNSTVRFGPNDRIFFCRTFFFTIQFRDEIVYLWKNDETLGWR